MKFRIPVGELKHCIELVTRFINTRNPLVAAQNVLIDCSENEISFYGTDVESLAKVTIMDEITVAEHGKVTVNGDAIQKFIRNIDTESSCELELKKKELAVKTEAGNAFFKIIDPDQFPETTLDESGDVIFESDSERLVHILNRTLISAAVSLDRPNLAAICFDMPKQNIASTNGFSLSVMNNVLSETEKLKYLVPRTSALRIKSVLSGVNKSDASNVEIYLGSRNNMIFAFVDGERRVYISTQLIDGHFPDYTRIIPNEPVLRVYCNANELNRLLKVAKIFADTNSIVTFAIDGDDCTIESESINHGTWFGDLKPEGIHAINSDERQMTISFNIDYMLDITALFKNQSLNIWLTEARRPAAITQEQDWRSSEFMYVVMPMTGVRVQRENTEDEVNEGNPDTEG